MLSRLSVKKPYTVIVGIVLVIILGVVSFTNMTADLLPSMNLPYAVVITTYPGASPEEVELAVSKPVESSMATISNISNISSVSRENMSLVICEFEESANMDSVTIEMRENLDQISSYWSESVGKPIIMKLNPDMLPIMVAAVSKDDLTSAQVTEYVAEFITPEIESIVGVASVSSTGNVEETIHVIIDDEKIREVNEKIMASLDKSFAEAEEKLEKAKAEIIDGKEKLETGKIEMANQLSEAERTLSNSQIETIKGSIEIEKQLKEVLDKESEILSGETELAVKEQELLKAEQELISNEQSLNAGITGLEAAKEGLLQLNKAKAELEQSMFELSTSISEIEEMGNQAPADLKAKLPVLKQHLATLEENLNQVNSQIESIGLKLDEINTKLSEANAGLVEIRKGKEEIETGKASIKTAKEELKVGKSAVLAGKTALEKAKQDIESGQVTISEALQELSKNEILSSIEMSSTANQIATGEKEIDNALQTLEEQKDNAYEKASLHNILTIDMVKGILKAQNFNMPAGYITEEGTEYLIRVGDKITDQNNLAELTLLDMNMDGVDPIKLSDVAEVVTVNNSNEVYAVVNGNPAIMLNIEKQTGYSTGEVSNRINAKFEKLMKLDDTLHITSLMDQGIYIDLIINSVLQNMISGGILAIIILFLFLKDIRPTFVVACSIPISIMTAVVLMYFSGISLNVISLSGLALGVGMLVDNSIVVIENIYRLRSEGYSAKKAAVEGSKQVTGAIIASTLTTVCVFLPIVFTEGITKQLFVDMGLTIGYSLLASLIIALTLVPMMGAGLLKNTKDQNNRFFDKVTRFYGAILNRALSLKVIVLLASVVILILSIIGAVSNGTAFMPSMESTQVTITLKTDKDTTFEEMKEVSNEVINRIMEIEDVDSIGAMAGGGSVMNFGGGSSSSNSITMYLLLREDKKLSGNELTTLILDKTSDLNCELDIQTATMDMSALGGTGVSIEIKGKDLDKLQEIATDVANIVRNVEGTTEVSNGLDEATPEYRIIVDKDKASEYKLTVAQVYQEIYKKVSAATTATTITTDTKDFDVYVMSEKNEELIRSDFESMTIAVTESDGTKKEILISDIADLSNAIGPSSIRRDGGQRYLTVTASVDNDHNIGLVGNKINDKLKGYEVPNGYSVVMTGENETINDAMKQVGLMLLLAVVFMYLIMVAQFQSLLSPFIIMFTIPLAFTGGFLGLFFTGSEISVIAMIGFVMLSGIIVNNGIVLVDCINQLRRDGMDKKEAIIEAGRTRLRPIFMTALTTILGLTTLAAGMGMGADMIQPMAIVAIGGLIYGTLLTLFVVPCMYDILNRNKSMVEEEI